MDEPPLEVQGRTLRAGRREDRPEGGGAGQPEAPDRWQRRPTSTSVRYRRPYLSFSGAWKPLWASLVSARRAASVVAAASRSSRSFT